MRKVVAGIIQRKMFLFEDKYPKSHPDREISFNMNVRSARVPVGAHANLEFLSPELIKWKNINAWGRDSKESY